MFSSNTSQQSEGYQIQRSLRFNSADSAYLNRTPASVGNRRTWTWSAWVKRSNIDTYNMLFATSNGQIYFDNQKINVTLTPSAGIFITTAVYRDVSAWYHIVVACDTTQATDTNRMKLYVNGIQVTNFSTQTAISQNADTSLNEAVEHGLGRFPFSPYYYFNGYMTEVNFIDGQALTPSSFGQTNANTGVWEPKPYAGTYGTNGFYLNFSDNSNTTATTLGKDYSGNGNNWTPNNFSVSAGAGNDSLVDVPTPWGTDTGVGGTVRGNYATLNPIDTSGSNTFTNGNLDVSVAQGSTNNAVGTIAVSSGKWYWEVTPTSGTSGIFMIGVIDTAGPASARSWATQFAWAYYSFDGSKYTSNTGSSYGASYAVNDVIGVALDMDAGTLVFYKNGTSQGTAYSTGLAGKNLTPAVMQGSNNSGAATYTVNLGQRPFASTAPSGFKALCTQNLPTPTVGATAATQAGKYFNPVLYTGTQTTKSVTGVGFQPDFVWIKNRNVATEHALFDVVRGALLDLRSNATAAEITLSGSLTSFDSDGFSLGNAADPNKANDAYVAWNWKANGAGVTNTAGSITSTVSANTTSGFSVVTWTGNASGGATIGHGLGSAPKMVIIKNRGATSDWIVGHSSLTSWGYFLKLNTTAAQASASTVWNNTAPTSTVVTLGSDGAVNGSTASMVAYCFAEVPGYSRFGSYTGNGSSDGPFVFCGFRPAYVMIKATAGTDGWAIQDATRFPSNEITQILVANSSGSESSFSSDFKVDFLANGFKVRNISSAQNTNGTTYIFAAFASAPQKFALAR